MEHNLAQSWQTASGGELSRFNWSLILFGRELTQSSVGNFYTHKTRLINKRGIFLFAINVKEIAYQRDNLNKNKL